MLEILVVVAAWLVSMVAGLLLVFAIVVMPGIATLDDRKYLESFTVMDRVIQDNQPIFVMLWGGSILASLAAIVLSLIETEGPVRTLVVVGATAYLLGVQLTTFLINIPLNNAVRAADLTAMDEQSLADLRSVFEPRWVRWNQVRTAVAALASLTLIMSVLLL
jgi:uncharacterized membrane protein